MRSRIEIKNCQTWLREFMVELIEAEILPAEALEELDKAPEN